MAGCRIDSVAGRGGMGVVYRATQLGLERPVALKVIAPDFATDAIFAERFKTEARLAASIEHPNVVPIYEAGEGEGLLYLLMRLRRRQRSPASAGQPSSRWNPAARPRCLRRSPPPWEPPTAAGSYTAT